MVSDMAAVDLEGDLCNVPQHAPSARDESDLTAVIDRARQEKEHFPSHDLEVFQTLAGIRFLDRGGRTLPNVKRARRLNPLLDIFFPSIARRNALNNRGLYDRAVSRDLRNRILYTLSNYIIAALYILQIFVAATLTAVSGYARASTVVLTVLGAINTVLAGFLAWLTGQGMPVRFRRARDQWRELVKEIESTERIFAEIDLVRWAPGQRPDPMAERDRLERMYEDARLDQEANYPDTQNAPSSTQTIQRLQQAQDKIVKHKARKETHRKELEDMQLELQALRSRV